MEPYGRWHPEGDRKKPLFIEWVYFKFFSAEADGIIVFGSGWGLPGVISVQLFPKAPDGTAAGPPIRVVRHDYPPRDVWRSKDSYACRIGPCSVAVRADGMTTTGEVSGEDHHLTWSLDVVPHHPPWAGYYGRFGALSLGTIGWDLIAPAARVSGAISVDGRALGIDGPGYVDTNYGRWLFALDVTTHWDWALGLADDGLVVAAMNIRHRPELGALLYASADRTLRFPTTRGTFRHEEHTIDPVTGVAVPCRTLLRADTSQGHRLELELVSRGVTVYRQGIPPKEMRGPLPTPFEWALCESFIDVRGELVLPDGACVPVRARGIQEHPVTRIGLHR